MLSRLFLGPAIDAVADVLRGAPPGPVAVVGQPRLARGLAERGAPVIAVDDEPRALKKLRGATPVRARAAALPVGDRALGALVGWGAGTHAAWPELLVEWSRAVADGGLLVLVDRAPATELSRRALCGGLAELQQRPAGRVIVTSGVVTDL